VCVKFQLFISDSSRYIKRKMRLSCSSTVVTWLRQTARCVRACRHASYSTASL